MLCGEATSDEIGEGLLRSLVVLVIRRVGIRIPHIADDSPLTIRFLSPRFDVVSSRAARCEGVGTANECHIAAPVNLCRGQSDLLGGW